PAPSPALAHPACTEVTPAPVLPPRRSRRRSFLILVVRESGREILGLLSNIEPIEECIRRLEPDAKPLGDLRFFRALLLFHFGVACDHLGAPLAQPRHIQHTLRGCAFFMRLEPPEQLIESHDTDFRVIQRLEVEQVFKFFLELLLSFGLNLEVHFVAVVFENVGDIVSASFGCFAMLGDEPAAQLVDFRGRPVLRGYLPRRLQNQFLLGLLRIVHRAISCSGTGRVLSESCAEPQPYDALAYAWLLSSAAASSSPGLLPLREHRREGQPADGDTFARFCCVPPAWRQKNGRLGCWPRSRGNSFGLEPGPRARLRRPDCRSAPEANHGSRMCCMVSRCAGHSASGY